MSWTDRPDDWGQPGHLNRSDEFEAVLDQISDLTTRTETVEAGAWTPWVPTLTNITQGSGVVVARYAQLGDIVHYRFKFTFGSGSAMGSSPSITLPVAPGSDYLVMAIGHVRILDSGTANYFGYARLSSGSTIEMTFVGTTDIDSTITSTAPMTWTTNDVLTCVGTYEAL